ncbi:hypothetical protein C1I98_05230 [Spongiactinospora gelatinilytica]|uniref:Uncharacterized protein n=1 Tax=Spongiactinospora gelatinilytica TaxID=2666298 RepID=A0A2W2H1N9_9ACTN|nr:hypothetical protein C1I98_05230 [Spongiactinospora gelatinilytica]
MLKTLSVASVRERWTAFTGGFVALLLGAAMVSMTGLALLSAGPEVPGRLRRGTGTPGPRRRWAPTGWCPARRRGAGRSR